jgi:23S rRNA maturation mini-RNase III
MQYYLHKERPYNGNINQQPTFFVEMINALTEKEVEVRNFKRGKNGR